MSFWNKFKFAFLKVHTFFTLTCHIYYIWSRFGRWIYEREFAGKSVSAFTSLSVLESYVANMEWVKDKWYQFGDMISYPAAAEARFKNGEALGDCDEFSMFFCSALPQTFSLNPKDLPCFRDISMLTVPYVMDTGKFDGHNVCVFRYCPETSTELCWAWASNWFNGKVQFTSFTDINCIVKEIEKLAKAKCYRWARVSPDLKTVYEIGVMNE